MALFITLVTYIRSAGGQTAINTGRVFSKLLLCNAEQVH